MREQNEQMLFFLSMLHAACSMMPCKKPGKSLQQNVMTLAGNMGSSAMPCSRRSHKSRIRKSNWGSDERCEGATIHGFQLVPYLTIHGFQLVPYMDSS
jgi:hypothetical protein